MLEVGDYILSPRIAVERKSPSDLSESLKNGRLYKQCQAMSLNYTNPILLIEYPQRTSFQLSFSSMGNELDTARRLCLLLIHFPKLFIIWSSSPVASAEIFEDLQKEELDPNLGDAQACGVDSSNKVDASINQTAMEMLLSLPGVNFKNFHRIMRNVKNIRELSESSLGRCEELVGVESGRLLYEFFREKTSVTIN
jgi:DNA excision repair protein ERCC-4